MPPEWPNDAVGLEKLPRVSVGLPTFNRATSLRRAIESVLAQDYPNLELVISDNASSDHTQAMCEKYASRDERVRYIRQHSNRGALTNFQAVLDAAEGHYFMWLGDDDWLDDSYVTGCVKTLLARPELSLVAGVARYFDGDRLVFEGVRMNLLQESPADRVTAFYEQVSDNGTFYGISRRALLIALPTGNRIGSDWILIASLALQGKILTLDDVVVSRAQDGVSSDLKSLALKSGLSKRKAERPYQAIARNTFSDIMRDSPAFAKLGLVTRMAIATKVMLIFYRRFIVNEHPWVIWSNNLRYKLKLRTRIKRTLRIR
jgi:glycosyltransferase involved in cell wall biosynthesis